jgi:hypothetical protein
MSTRQRTLWAAVTALALALVGAWRGLRQVVPAGAPLVPYACASVDGPVLTSPDGRLALRVVFNDAGAAHSGNHWTWVVRDDWLTGKRVVAAGYTSWDVRDGTVPFPARWVDERTLAITLLDRRHGGAPYEVRVRLD